MKLKLLRINQFWALVICIGLALLLSACEIMPPTQADQEDLPYLTLETTVLSNSLAPTATPHLSRPSETAPLPTATLTMTATPEPMLRFAIIGDYGLAGQHLADVAALIQSWDVELIVTTGDNNYPDGAVNTIDENIGQYFHEFIFPYQGEYGEGADRNRFFPTLGNHDWHAHKVQPYLDYFSLPGNERYYDVVWEPVHFFALDSSSREPDGVGLSSAQAKWFRKKIGDSSVVWKIVIMHHAPYSSAHWGSIDWAQWPYQEWGASIVIAGHDHVYERLLIDGFPYIINGLGGKSRYDFNDPIPGSLVRYRGDYGAMLVEATVKAINFQFITVGGDVIDSYTLYPTD